MRPALRPLPLLACALGLAGVWAQATAADDPSATRVTFTTGPQSVPTSRWTYDFETAYVFWTIQNPFWLLAAQRGVYNTKNPWHYELDSYLFGGRYDLSRVGGWGFLRGYWQASVGVIGSDIVRGPEHYYAGVLGGLRYLFVPGDGTWAPYVEFREAAGATDASHVPFGQQDDISFMYLFGIGVRYQRSPKWRVSLGIVDQHMSDAYLTKDNFGFDSVGVNLMVELRP